MWLRSLLVDAHHSQLMPIPLFVDNQSAIRMAQNPIFHDKTKHIETQYHFTREKVIEGLIDLQYVPTAKQKASLYDTLNLHNNVCNLITRILHPFHLPLALDSAATTTEQSFFSSLRLISLLYFTLVYPLFLFLSSSLEWISNNQTCVYHSSLQRWKLVGRSKRKEVISYTKNESAREGTSD